METFEMAKQMIDFQKTTFNNTYNAMVTFQDQTEKMTHAFLDQTPGMPEVGKKAIGQWMDVCKKGRDDFKKAADENFEKVEKFLNIGK